MPETPEYFDNIVVGQYAMTGVPLKVYVNGRYLMITDPDDVENPLIGFGMTPSGEMERYSYKDIDHLLVASNVVDIETYKKAMETEEEGEEEGGEGGEGGEEEKEEESPFEGGEEEKEDTGAPSASESVMPSMSNILHEADKESIQKKIDKLKANLLKQKKDLLDAEEDELTEAPIDTFYIKVGVRDSRKALNIINSEYRHEKIDISGDTYYFKDKSVAYDVMMDFHANDIEIIGKSEDIDESVINEKKQLPKEISKHKDIPSWARYVAQQSDGEWTWFEETPTMMKWKNGGGWKSDGNQTYTGVKTDGKDWDKMPTYYYVKNGKITESVNEGKTIPLSKIRMMGAKILNKIRIGTQFVTDDNEYTVTGFGPQAQAFKEFEVDDKSGIAKKVKLTAMYGVKFQVNDDPRSAVFRKEEGLNSIILESVNEDWSSFIDRNELANQKAEKLKTVIEDDELPFPDSDAKAIAKALGKPISKLKVVFGTSEDDGYSKEYERARKIHFAGQKDGPVDLPHKGLKDISITINKKAGTVQFYRSWLDGRDVSGFVYESVNEGKSENVKDDIYDIGGKIYKDVYTSVNLISTDKTVRVRDFEKKDPKFKREVKKYIKSNRLGSQRDGNDFEIYLDKGRNFKGIPLSESVNESRKPVGYWEKKYKHLKKKPKYKKGDRVVYVQDLGGPWELSPETDVVKKVSKGLAGYKYMLTNFIQTNDSEILGLAETVNESVIGDILIIADENNTYESFTAELIRQKYIMADELQDPAVEGELRTMYNSIHEAINEAVNENTDAYALHRLADNVGQSVAEEFLMNHNVDLKLLAKAVQQKTINKYEVRDVINNTAHKSKIKQFMDEFVKEPISESVNEVENNADDIAAGIDKALYQIDPHMDYKDFAAGIASVLKQQYNKSNYDRFVMELVNLLKGEFNSPALNESPESNAQDMIRKGLDDLMKYGSDITDIVDALRGAVGDIHDRDGMTKILKSNLKKIINQGSQSMSELVYDDQTPSAVELDEGVMSELEILMDESNDFNAFLGKIKLDPRFKEMDIDSTDVKQFLEDLWDKAGDDDMMEVLLKPTNSLTISMIKEAALDSGVSVPKTKKWSNASSLVEHVYSRVKPAKKQQFTDSVKAIWKEMKVSEITIKL